MDRYVTNRIICLSRDSACNPQVTINLVKAVNATPYVFLVEGATDISKMNSMCLWILAKEILEGLKESCWPEV